MPRVALITADAARARDEDMEPLLEACKRVGIDAEVVSWNTPKVYLSGFDAALLRSPWDYADRLEEFLSWCDRCAMQTMLLNPLDVVHWNIDKHYLADLAQAGIACVPSVFAEPGQHDAESRISTFLEAHTGAVEFVVKPAVGAGSRDACRYTRADIDAANRHAGALLDANRSVLLQPYLARVDARGETSLLYFGGDFSHAIRKGPLLQLGGASADPLFAPEAITARVPSAGERRLGDAVIAEVRRRFADRAPLAYVRVDLLHDDADEPCVLELELVEPSLFFAHGPGSADRFARCLLHRLR